jgi:hypothetical protein
LFSSSNVHSFRAFFKKEFGQGRSMTDLMLSFTKPVVPLDVEAVSLLISPPQLAKGTLKASTAVMRCAGLSAFVKYLIT